MKIFFDMDNVLADFERGVAELCKIVPPSPDDEPGEADTRMWNAIREVDHFYDQLEPVDGALELFGRIFDRYGSDCEILTAIPKPKRQIPDAADDKRKWASRNLSPDVKVNIVYKEEKKAFCTGKDCILIDDMMKNIDDWEMHGGTGILFRGTEGAKRELEELGVL